MEYYTEISNELKNKYNRHYNLYQKQQLEHKVLCYKNSNEDPLKYQQCIDDINTRMNMNSTTLRNRYNQIEIDDKDCHGKCYEDPKCMKGCEDQSRKKANQLQEQFYKLMLQENPEYKKLQ
ncbi:unnamed protein product (macronuclear) [Paramecium tetraurelia]|uniref:Uncharacterized protein n=1 Tax=Paramecium tetraurelia TaxID=5888 RepID=A0DSV9_PARTE|nr:uncharacterized protein GSPATT00019819001 [Paramecium tetraurelia]CAK86126.1 unnamed protein product [Paramecium tetraurelia]|eukprot:XP_001453523.1 hypothetical protein (macronuclear) [Paramecium tetraurelia strain d4-2]